MMRIRNRIFAGLATLGIALALAMVASPASAALSYVFESAPTEDVPDVLDDTITGIDMRDMVVTVLRTDGETDTRVWGATTAGRAIGIGWSLNVLSGETGVDAWGVANSLSHAPIFQMILQGKPGRVLFDVEMYDPTRGSACAVHESGVGLPLACSTGSGQGRRFVYLSGDFEATVTYSDPVGLAGAAPVGDLFYTMTIEFARPGMGAGTFSFFQDTDLAGRSAVPLPAPAALLAAAWFALVARQRRVQYRRQTSFT